MVQYKLYYFDIPGLAEPIRMLFAYAGQAFEDVRLNKDKDWPTQKSKFPYGQVPVLEVDGKQLSQSLTIMKYLAKKFGLAGKDDWEEAKASEIADLHKDFSNEGRAYASVKMGFAKGDLDQLRKDVWVPTRDKFMPMFEKLLASSKSGFFLPSGISYVDLIVAYYLSRMREMEKGDLEKYPKLMEFVERVHGQPQLKEYMAKRKA